MNKIKVILSKPFHPEVIEQLKAEFELILDEKQSLADIVHCHQDAVALISFLSDTIDRQLIDSLPNLRIIANYAVGYNNIDFQYALQKGIFVTHTPDVLTAATAEIAATLILTVCRKIIPADRFTRGGQFRGWKADLFLGKDLSPAQLGIVGLGRIGLATALRMQPFVKQITYYSRSRKPELEKKFGLIYQTFLDLVKTSDIISLHLPFSPDLYHLFNQDTFALMKKDAVFINVSRGKLMDENALCDFLENGHLFGAGLDVYENEPQINPRLLEMENVVLLPHIGSATFNTRKEMAMITLRSVQAALRGEKPPYLIPEAITTA